MRVIGPRSFNQRPKRPALWRRAVKPLALVVAVVAAVNLLLVAWFYNRAYPHTTLGAEHVGGRSFASILERAAQNGGVPRSVTLTGGASPVSVALADLHSRTDTQRTRRSLEAQRSWLPLAALFQTHQVAVPVSLQQPDSPPYAAVFHRDPADAKVTKNGTRFAASAAQDGQELDTRALPAAITAALDRGERRLRAPTTRLAPKVLQAQARQTAARLQASLGATLTYTNGGGSQTLAATAIASWYVPNGNTYVLDDFLVRTAIAAAGRKLGIRAGNLTAAVASTKTAVANGSKATIALTPFAQTKTLHYCLASRGDLGASLVNDIKTKLAATYADLRGWSLDGQVIYEYAETGCDFTVWASTPDQMTTFSSVCDTYWNCEAEGNVVINTDRWQQATPAWNATGMSIDDYRVMLINHETGHMLGFGHLACPGAGQPAPVMMQQSIDRGGCNFNIWPVPDELAQLRARLGL